MIEVGDYIRLNNGKIIRFEKFGIYRTHTRKINGKYETGTFENKCIISGRCHYKYDNIVKHSKNIIDLIEEGDYVISQDGIEGKVEFVMLPLKIFVDGEEVLNDDIKSIVTKEKFEAMEYKVKE